jgi:hypothetical protein
VIWLGLRWLLLTLPVWIACALSALLVPPRVHASFWDKQWACSFGLHDHRHTDKLWTVKCRRCGDEAMRCPY